MSQRAIPDLSIPSAYPLLMRGFYLADEAALFPNLDSAGDRPFHGFFDGLMVIGTIERFRHTLDVAVLVELE